MAGFAVFVDRSGDSVAKQVRRAQTAQTNFILVVGDEEVGKQEVSVRRRDAPVGERPTILSLPAFLEQLRSLVAEYK